MGQNGKPASAFPWKELLSFLGVVLVAYIGYLGVRSQTQIPIQATQTAEAKSAIGSASTPAATPGASSTPTPQLNVTAIASVKASPQPRATDSSQPALPETERIQLEVIGHDGARSLLLDPAVYYPSTFGPSALTEGIRVRRGAQAAILLWTQVQTLSFRSRQEANENGTPVWRHAVEAALSNGQVVSLEIEDDWNMAYMGGGGTGLLFGQTDLGETQIAFSDIAKIVVLSASD